MYTHTHREMHTGSTDTPFAFQFRLNGLHTKILKEGTHQGITVRVQKTQMHKGTFLALRAETNPRQPHGKTWQANKGLWVLGRRTSPRNPATRIQEEGEDEEVNSK